MKYFKDEEIEHKLDFLDGILAMQVNEDSDVIIIKHHLLDLINAQSTLVRVVASAKYLYNKDKRNLNYATWWEHAQQLSREFGHKLSVLQSVLKAEIQQQNIITYGK